MRSAPISSVIRRSDLIVERGRIAVTPADEAHKIVQRDESLALGRTILLRGAHQLPRTHSERTRRISQDLPELLDSQPHREVRVG